MKNMLLNIINKYLEIYPEEQERQTILINYLNSHNAEEIVDWNNFDGHIVAGGFIYAKEEGKFLVLYHKDLKMFLYPGGHVDAKDNNPLEASKREIEEETGLSDLQQLKLYDEELVPIDIDTHKIGYNERLNLPEHYHFDFRYLFTIERIENINIDSEELGNYQWISIDELRNDPNYGKIATKVEKLLIESRKSKTN